MLSMQSRMREVQKKIVVSRMMRMKITWKARPEARDERASERSGRKVLVWGVGWTGFGEEDLTG